MSFSVNPKKNHSPCWLLFHVTKVILRLVFLQAKLKCYIRFHDGFKLWFAFAIVAMVALITGIKYICLHLFTPQFKTLFSMSR